MEVPGPVGDAAGPQPPAGLDAAAGALAFHLLDGRGGSGVNAGGDQESVAEGVHAHPSAARAGL